MGVNVQCEGNRRSLKGMNLYFWEVKKRGGPPEGRTAVTTGARGI